MSGVAEWSAGSVRTWMSAVLSTVILAASVFMAQPDASADSPLSAYWKLQLKKAHKERPFDFAWGTVTTPTTGECLFFEACFKKPATEVSVSIGRFVGDDNKFTLFSDVAFSPGLGFQIGPWNGWIWQPGQYLTVEAKGFLPVNITIPSAGTRELDDLVGKARAYSMSRAASGGVFSGAGQPTEPSASELSDIKTEATTETDGDRTPQYDRMSAEDRRARDEMDSRFRQMVNSDIARYFSNTGSSVMPMPMPSMPSMPSMQTPMPSTPMPSTPMPSMPTPMQGMPGMGGKSPSQSLCPQCGGSGGSTFAPGYGEGMKHVSGACPFCGGTGSVWR